MEICTKLILKTNYGIHDGLISEISDTKESITYTGFLQKPSGTHTFELVFIKKDKHFSGSVFWDEQKQKQVGHNASFIEDFEVVKE